MNRKGQTLIEIAVALGIATIVIVALVILAASGLRNAQDTIRRSESAKLANAGIEAVIYYKNVAGYNSGLLPQNNNDKICYELVGAGGSTSLQKVDPYSCSDNQDDTYIAKGYVDVISPSTNLTYQRKITVQKTGDYQYEVFSTVDWVISGGKVNTVSVKRILTNWK